MISIIVCSKIPEMAEMLKRNIEESIGRETQYEFIIFDNHTENLPIAKVYNKCAATASGNNLFFVHEDVHFYSSGWGKTIEKKLEEQDCGVIGFTGSILKPAVYGGWTVNDDTERSYYRYIHENTERLCEMNMPSGSDFAQVITLDGFGMFVRKEVHKQYPFDEKVLTGFHCYDLDYTLAIARHYKNWCCRIEVLHKSNGNFNSEWIANIISIHDEKWNRILPMQIECSDFSYREIKEINDNALWFFFKQSLKAHSPLDMKILCKYCTLPVSFKHIRRVLSGLFKILRYKLS